MSNYAFTLILLAEKGLQTGQARRAIKELKLRAPFDDPSMSPGSGTNAGIESDLKDELRYAQPSPYRSLNLGTNFKWS